jgi:hypothetical protein
MQLIVLQSFNCYMDEYIHLKSTRSMYVCSRYFRADLNYLGLVDTVLMYEGRLLEALLPK